MVRKYCIAHLGIILVNIQGGCFSSIHQKMRLITYFEKAFKNPCFKVIQSPFYWSTHCCTRILFVCLWQSAKDPWMATYFHHKDLISVLWILTKLYTVGLQPLTGRVRTEYFRIELLKCAKIAFFVARSRKSLATLTLGSSKIKLLTISRLWRYCGPSNYRFNFLLY